jgi:hypothetical protein
MSTKINPGDTVQVVARETTAADVKSQLYFPHYAGLQGEVTKVYDDGTASVNISIDSLPDVMRKRHMAGSEEARLKWLNGISDEARNKLSAAEKKFNYRYTLLVATTDLVPATGASHATAKPATAPDAVPTPPRKSLAEIEAEEARHLEEISRQKSA